MTGDVLYKNINCHASVLKISIKCHGALKGRKEDTYSLSKRRQICLWCKSACLYELPGRADLLGEHLLQHHPENRHYYN